MSIDTTCVQGGYRPGDGEPRQLPIIQSTTFKYDTSEQMGRLFDLEETGYFYTRLQNPTNDAVAAKIAQLEGGAAGMLTSSGQAANFFALFNICEAGSHVVASSAIYGGTYNLLAHTMAKMGIESTFVSPDCTDEELEAAFRPNTQRRLWRDDRQPRARRSRHRALRHGGARAQRAAHRGQHVPHAGELPSHRVGRRHRDALHHQVHGRPRCGRGRRHR